MKLPYRAHTALIGPLLLCAAVPARAAGPDTVFIVGGEGRVLAASNPLLLPSGRRAAILAEASLRPQLTLSSDTGDSLALDGVFTGRTYSRRYGHYLLGGARALGTIRSNERLTITAATAFQRDITVDTLATSVDALVDPTSIRNSWRGEAAVDWRPDARTVILPSITAERSTYGRSLVLQNTKSASFGLAVRRRLDEVTELGIRAITTLSRVAAQPNLNRLALFATIDRRLTDAWRLEAEIGMERIGAVRSDDAGVFSDRPAQTAMSGRVRLCREGGLLDACLTARRGSEVSAIDGFQRRSAASLSATRRIDARSAISTEFEYERIAGSNGSTFRRSLDAQRAIVRYERRLNERLTLSGEVEFLRRQLGIGSTPRSAFAGVRLRWESRRR